MLKLLNYGFSKLESIECHLSKTRENVHIESLSGICIVV